MKSVALCIVLLAGVLPVLASPISPPTFHLERTTSRRIQAEAAITINPSQKLTEWLIIAAALPKLERQKAVSTKLLVDAYESDVRELADDSLLKRPYLFLDVPQPGGTFQFKMVYIATLMQTKLVKGPPDSPIKPLTQVERSHYTSPSTALNFQEPVFRECKQRNGLSRKGGENELDYAYCAFCWIIQHSRYSKIYSDFNAAQVCTTMDAACGGLSALFAATMRSEVIPSRLLAGRYALPPTPDEVRTSFFGSMVHVKAEVWISDIG